mmetsp:Transcript_13017/g.20399  ORF Transcript_13017/g.20399 Transcript_13017/m.20399 type:complete len:340 (+) Transcript_13017:1659-2678(+)
MHAKDLGVIVDGQCSDEVFVVLQVTQQGHRVNAAGRHLVLVLQHLRPEKVAQDGQQRAPVPGVCDSATVHNLPDHINQRIPRHSVLLVQEHEQPLGPEAQIDVPELIFDVPAQRPEFLALGDDGMEQAQAEQQLVVRVLLRALREGHLFVEEVDVLDVVVAPQHIGADTRRVLIRELDGVLEDGDGEEGRGHGREPQAERGVHGACRVRPEVRDDLLQLRHEGLGQVAVLQDHPVPILPARVKRALRGLALALPQRDHVHTLAEAPGLGKVQEEREGVGAGGQNEDDGGRAVGVLCGVLDAEGRRVDEVRPEVPLDELGHREEQVWHPAYLDDDHALHL